MVTPYTGQKPKQGPTETVMLDATRTGALAAVSDFGAQADGKSMAIAIASVRALPNGAVWPVKIDNASTFHLALGIRLPNLLRMNVICRLISAKYG